MARLQCDVAESGGGELFILLVVAVFFGWTATSTDASKAERRGASRRASDGVGVEHVVQPRPVTTVFGETAELEQPGWQALERFCDAGLELPEVKLSLYESSEPCRRADGAGRSGVTIIHSTRYDVRSCGSDFVVLHELGHVWEHHNLNEAQRQALLDLRGLTRWHHPTWHLAGAEHAASILAWGLTGVAPTMLRYVDQGELAQAYELLTGSPAPTLVERGLELVDDQVRRVSTPPPVTTSSAGHGSKQRTTHVPH